MSFSSVIWQTILFFLTFWLGCYLIARDASRLQLWLAGLGMLAFYAGVVSLLLGTFAPSAQTAPAL
ncbi:MAG: hypothetical protein KC433_27045 [Anaerolineales bacterium]|nr:hypothetical protein [Anaerolineales bacterium]